jgi:phospholipase A1/A2
MGFAPGLSLATSAAPVTASEADSCTLIQDDRDRLECYDRASGFPGRVPVPPLDPSPAAAADTDARPASRSLIDQAWALGPDTDRYILGYHRPNYMLVARYTDDVNQEPFSPIFGAADLDEELDSVEARFQFSFKSRVWSTDDRRWGVWFAYTQMSQWQVYNGEISRPFRETNYEPEVLVSFRPDVRLGPFDFRLVNLGFNHQSNGRTQVLSRSWDRLYAEFGLERDQFALLTKIWYRLPESSSDDDNPDITRYLGYGELTGVYKWHDHSFSLMVRGNWNTSKGAARFSWTTPRLLGPIRGYVQAFTGYGDSMIDYNWKQNSIGAGIVINDIL